MIIKEFVKKHGITAKTCRVSENSNFLDDKTEYYHYSVTLNRGEKRLVVREMAPSGEATIPEKSMVLYFSTGTRWKRPPNATDVMESLIMEAQGIDQDFENWASDLGWDSDSRKAEQIYNTIKQQAAELLRFLGNEAFREALECKE